jgi:hypothetical protein
MGEIKSTLELVMERTSHLSLSKEEKVQQQRADFEKRLEGLLNKYAEAALSTDDFFDRIAKLQVEMKISDRQFILGAIFTRIIPENDNERWLKILENLVPDLIDSIRDILVDYHKQQVDLIQSSKKQLLNQLAQRHGIGGSAVIPNPEKDIGYLENLATIRRETQTRIETMKKQAL